MNEHDLHHLLREASDDLGPWAHDDASLVRRGRRSVRLRGAGVTVGTAACTALMVAGAYAVMPNDPDHTTVTAGASSSSSGSPWSSTQRTVSALGSSTLDPEHLSADEVARRCDIVSANQDWLPAGAEITWQGGSASVGDTVFGQYLKSHPNGDASAYLGRCLVPSREGASTAGRVDASQLTPDTDASVVADLCSRYAGIDMTGWSTVTWSSTRGTAGAVYRSDDGYAATCRLSDGPVDSDVYVQTVEQWQQDGSGGQDSREVMPNYHATADGQSVVLDYTGNIADGADITHVRVSTDGWSRTYPVVDGFLALNDVVPVRDVPGQPLPLHFTLTDAAGNVVNEYDHADLGPKAYEE